MLKPRCVWNRVSTWFPSAQTLDRWVPSLTDNSPLFTVWRWAKEGLCTRVTRSHEEDEGALCLLSCMKYLLILIR